jgi:hypothetical protein
MTDRQEYEQQVFMIAQALVKSKHKCTVEYNCKIVYPRGC